MCGIVGWTSAKPIDATTLVRMRDAMIHRGPDGEGLWLSADRCVGLAHRRLSIIDLSATANQPMVDADGRAVIVFNGEIYNHRELRRTLEKERVSFVTDHSDTECLLKGYLAWGLDGLLERLVGMFAFAIYDTGTRKLHLVRDRVGIKPLYFATVGQEILFASEIKAILKHPRVRAELDTQAFYHYLSFRASPAPHTLFRNIQCLAAAEKLTYDTDSHRWERRVWWDPMANARHGSGCCSLDEAQDKLEELLAASVDARLESDVPIGLFLSGGLDSSYILKLMAARLESTSTYTVSYPGYDTYNEDKLARSVAHDAGASHHEVPLTSADFVESLTRVAYYQDEPIAAPVCVPVFALSRCARDTGMKVILAGEGSDELFIGYDNWLRMRDASIWNRRLPAGMGCVRDLAYKLARGVFPLGHKAPEIFRRAASGQPLFWGGSMDFSEDAKRCLLGPSVKHQGLSTYDEVVKPIYQRFCSQRDARDVTAWMSYIDLRFRLPQLMLPRLDKMGMAFSIEGRVPFLDHRLIEFVFSLPPQWRGGEGKVGKMLLKRLAAKVLPREFVNRPKQGFQAPVREWRDSQLGQHFVPMLRRFSSETGLFDTETLERLLKKKNDRLYFSLVNFMLWYLLFIDNLLNNAEVDHVLRNPEVVSPLGA